jgi:hypothetical protein
VTSNTTVNLTTASVTTGKFDISLTGAFDGSVTSVPITIGNSSASFYYKDTTAGSPTITAAATGLTSGTQIETIAAPNIGGGGSSGGGAYTPPTTPAPTPTPTSTPTPTPWPAGTVDLKGKVDTRGVFNQIVSGSSADGMAKVTVDINTTGLTADGTPLTTISVSPMPNPPTPPSGANAIGLTYDFGPSGARFDRVVTITLKIQISPDSDGTISAQLTHFTAFAVFGPVVVTQSPTPTPPSTTVTIPPATTPAPSTVATPPAQSPVVTPTSTVPATSNPPVPASTPFAWWIIVVIVAALVIIMIIILVIRRGNRK